MQTVDTAYSRLDSFPFTIVKVALTVETEDNAKLLETSRREITRCQGDLVLGQILHDLLDPLNIFRELGIVRLVSLDDLFYSNVNGPSASG
jgi:hypothetical protein